MKDHGKKYREAAKLVEAGRSYPPADAVGLAAHRPAPPTTQPIIGTGSWSLLLPIGSRPPRKYENAPAFDTCNGSLLASLEVSNPRPAWVQLRG